MFVKIHIVVLAIAWAIVSAEKDLSAHKPDNEAVIKSFSRSFDPEGNYDNKFETSNGISASEVGTVGDKGALVVQGSTSWIARSGEPLAISYIADKDGYRATGYHLPTPPPIPLAIQRALDFLATKKPNADEYEYRHVEPTAATPKQQ